MSKVQFDENGQLTTVFALGTTQVMTVTTSSVQSTAFAAGCTIIRLSTTGVGHLHFATGTNPTASLTTSPHLPPNSVEYVKVNGGDKIAVIRGASAVDVSITQVV
jgi:hypothetical protein